MTGSNRAAALALAAAMVAGATAPGLSAGHPPLSGGYPGAGAPAARAGEAPGDGQSAQLPPVVVTATRVEQPVAEVGSAVTVISGEELRRRGIEFVADALQEVPGLTVPRSGTRGKTTGLFIRGANSEQALVLIDGVRANEVVSGRFDLAFLTTDNVERIEIIRGPQSPLYGSDALGGVVNIITRRGRGAITATAEALGGNYNTYSVDGLVQGGTERFGASFEASRFKTDNRFANDGFHVDTLSSRLDGRLTDRLSASVSVRRGSSEIGAPGQTALGPAVLSDRQGNRLTSVSTTIELQTASIWTQRLALGLSDQNLRFTGSFGFAKSQSLMRSVEWVHTVTPLRALSIVAGGEYRVDDGDFVGTGGKLFVTRALFAQAQLVTLGERLFLQAGGRLDDGTQFDDELTPKVAGAFLVRETGTRFHASWGKGIKGPTLSDLLFPGAGNPALEPQRVTGWDVGVDQQLFSRRVEVGVTFFRNDFTNLIFFSPELFSPVNVQAHSYGIESAVTVRPADWADLRIAYTHTEAIDDTNRSQLLRRPRNQGSAQVTLRPVTAAAVTASGLYVGERLDNTFEAPGTPSRRLGGYFRLDASATYRLPRLPGFRSLELLARVENMLDRKYEEVAGFPALGTNFLAGVRGTF